jgi:2-hydroxy-6-oxonona-2,4-dienedioate hydrolase
MNLQERWTMVDGRRVFARVGTETPEASPLVLVHGFIVAGEVYLPAAEALARDFTVYIPDLPGYGKSDAPPGPLDVPELADTVIRWMDAIAISHASFVGHSMGAQIVADLAARRPERVEKIVLQAPTVPAGERSVLIQAFRRWQNTRRESSDALERLAHEYFQTVGLWRALQIGRMVLRDRIEDKLHKIGSPTLLLRGTRDPIVGESWLHRLGELLRDGRIGEVAGGSHSVVYLKPERFVDAIRPFLLLE